MRKQYRGTVSLRPARLIEVTRLAEQSHVAVAAYIERLIMEAVSAYKLPAIIQASDSDIAEYKRAIDAKRQRSLAKNIATCEAAFPPAYL